MLRLAADAATTAVLFGPVEARRGAAAPAVGFLARIAHLDRVLVHALRVLVAHADGGGAHGVLAPLLGGGGGGERLLVLFLLGAPRAGGAARGGCGGRGRARLAAAAAAAAAVVAAGSGSSGGGGGSGGSGVGTYRTWRPGGRQANRRPAWCWCRSAHHPHPWRTGRLWGQASSTLCDLLQKGGARGRERRRYKVAASCQTRILEDQAHDHRPCLECRWSGVRNCVRITLSQHIADLAYRQYSRYTSCTCVSLMDGSQCACL